MLELFATESALARARAENRRLTRRERSLALRRERQLARSAVVRRSLAATNRRIESLLRRLYEEGPAEPIAVLLGARSLDAVLEGADALARGARRNRDLAREALLHKRALALHGERLERSRGALADARSLADAAATRLEAAVAAKRSTLAGLRRRQDVTGRRLEALRARAREAQRASERLAPRASRPARVASPDAAAVAPGTRTLVVDAVAYHLPGRTASGLPVGVGVIAVDPSVIPLGTRVFVPGYGSAVAADTGTAIKGAIIDLWMPSTAAARAWGRRTVTITVYG